MQPSDDFLKAIHLQELQEFLDTPSSSNLFRAFPWKASPQGHDYWDGVHTAASLSGMVHGDDWEIVNGFKLAVERMQRQDHRMRLKRVFTDTTEGKYSDIYSADGKLLFRVAVSELTMRGNQEILQFLVKSGYSIWDGPACIAGELYDMLYTDNME